MKWKTTQKLGHWWQSFEQYPRLCWLFSGIWLLALNLIAFIWHLGATGLVDETEPLFAEAARQMTVTGNWVTPYFNEETRFDKPPLIYWLMAIGYKLIGVNEWAVRLPSALAAIALVILGFYTLRYFGFPTPIGGQNALTNPRKVQRQLWLSAWIGSALMALNLHTIIWAHTGVSDMLLSGCMGTGLLCFFWGYATSEKPAKSINYWYLACYILIALAVLTKGPVGLVLPGLIIVSFLVYVGQFWVVIREMKILWGGLIFLLITVPWYVLVILENGQAYINSFFGYHNFQRFTGVVNGHDAPWYFYFLIVLGLFAPWSVYLPLAIARIRFWQRLKWSRQPRATQLGLFAFCWFSCIFVFFTISVTKLPSYVLPLIPPASILVALTWSKFLTLKQKYAINYGFLISIIANLLLVIAVAIAFVKIPYFIGNDPAILNLKDSLLQSGLTWRGSIIWGITAVLIAVSLLKKNQWRWTIGINLIAFLSLIAFVLIPATFLIDQVRQLPLRELSTTVLQVQQPQEKLLMVGFKKPSVVFYTQRPVEFLKLPEDARNYLRQQTDHQSTLTSLLLIGRSKEIERMGLPTQDYQSLAVRGVYQLIRIPLDPN